MTSNLTISYKEHVIKQYSMLPHLCYENMLEDAMDLKLIKKPNCRSKLLHEKTNILQPFFPDH